MLCGNAGRTLDGIDKASLVPPCRAGAAGSWQALGAPAAAPSQAVGPHTLPLPGLGKDSSKTPASESAGVW